VNASLAAHTLLIAAVILVPSLWPIEMPDIPDYVVRLVYNPPPPPPPPLPRGNPFLRKQELPKPATTAEVEPQKPTLTMPVEDAPLRPEDRVNVSEQAGSANGSDAGMPEGMESGVVGGVPGGVPGGVVGGCVGCTGDNPVMDYDQPPKLIKTVRPQYPQEAFVKKVEGDVLVEILIDATGRVVRARVLQSIPQLDAAAIQTVYQWQFSPAVKQGRPVATIAHAPVRFRIL
jgi:protein TonB